MRKPLSLPSESAPDGELPRPILLPDDSSGHRAADRDGWPGLAYLTVAATALTAGGYGASYVAEYWPPAVAPLLTLGPSAVLGFSVWLVRTGVANPWIRKYERWRKVSFDWKDRALQAEAELDRVAREFTGEDDPAAARRIMGDRLERLKKGQGRGRPRGSRTAMDHETWLQKAREVRNLRRQGMTWDNIGKRLDINGDTASEWLRSLNEIEGQTA